MFATGKDSQCGPCWLEFRRVEGDFGELINWVSFEERKRLKSLYTDVRDVCTG
jgi:hypothetical protein